MQARRTCPRAQRTSTPLIQRLRSDAGVTAIEYGLLVALVALAVLAGVTMVGSRLSGAFTNATCALSGASEADCGATAVAADPVPMLQPATDWCPPSTNGTIICRAVDKLNSLPWGNSDITMATTAALTGTTWNQQTGTGANGYGVWLRATQTAGFGVSSGYTFQVDPGAGSRFVVKVWNTTSTNNLLNRTETTLGMVNFPPGFDPTANNRVSVSLVGNNLSATVNGAQVFSNFDVAAATASKGKTPPTGTRFGVRTWGQAGLNMDSTTIM